MTNHQIIVRDAQSGDVLAQAILEQDVIELEGCYYFKREHVSMDRVKISARTYTCPYKGVCFWIDLKTDDTNTIENIGFSYTDTKADYNYINSRIGFYGRSMRGLTVEKKPVGNPATA